MNVIYASWVMDIEQSAWRLTDPIHVRLRSLSPPVPGNANHPFRTVLRTAHPGNDGRRQAPQPYMTLQIERGCKTCGAPPSVGMTTDLALKV